VDFLQDFLDVLEERAKSMGVADRISTLACSMDNLPFTEEELDVIWSEGAIYTINPVAYMPGFFLDWNNRFGYPLLESIRFLWMIVSAKG